MKNVLKMCGVQLYPIRANVGIVEKKFSYVKGDAKMIEMTVFDK